jgi:GDPmannose 4,6-dehydratase
VKTAIITGVNGQDGSYLAELLLSKGYRVVGTVRKLVSDMSRIVHLRGKIDIVETHLLDEGSLENMLRDFQPHEVYNLAARASSRELWLRPVLVSEVNGLGVTRLLEAIRAVNPEIRFCQASSSEMFGNSAEVPQTESTPLSPRNPYGAAKAYAHWITRNYRDVQNLFACSGILYNHESPQRGLEFVTRKISHAAAKISFGLASELRLGDLDAKRDWGFAGDYMEAMWLMLQQTSPDDFVIATGELHSVREFCEIAFSHVGLNYQDYVVQDGDNFRSPDAVTLLGNPAKARRLLGWNPTMTFTELVQMLVDADLKALQNIPGQISPGVPQLQENTSLKTIPRGSGNS